jgi:sugar phosphate isomerase/epimerase
MAATPYMILSYGTVRYAAFPDRVAAAAEAGFGGIGLTLTEYRRLLAEGWVDREIESVLSTHAVSWTEIEMIAGFAATSGPANVPQRPGLRYADPDDEQTAFHIADVFGSRHLQVTGAFGDVPLERNVAISFGALCDRAASHDLLVALEFVPYTNVSDVALATSIVNEADRPNGGLCVDSWHYFQGTEGDLGDALDGRVMMIQLNDGQPLRPDQDRMVEAVHGRRCPGEGVFDLVRLVRALTAIAGDVPISVEVFSDELARRTTRDAARYAAETTRGVLAAAAR